MPVMVKCAKVMNELVEDFKTIWKKDKSLIVWMGVNFALSLGLFFVSILNLEPNSTRFFARYSDMASYSSESWWYMFSFVILAIVMGLGHCLLAARLHKKRGRDIARMFLGTSMVILVIAICFLGNIVGEG